MSKNEIFAALNLILLLFGSPRRDIGHECYAGDLCVFFIVKKLFYQKSCTNRKYHTRVFFFYVAFRISTGDYWESHFLIFLVVTLILNNVAEKNGNI